MTFDLTHRCAAAVALSLFLAPVAAIGAPTHTPTPKETLSRTRLRDPIISPDGRMVAYFVTQTDWVQNAFVSQLWLADAVTGRTVQLTRGKASASAVKWSPDGHWLAFLTTRDAAPTEPTDGPAAPDAGADKGPKEQVWLIAPDGGEAFQLTKAKADVHDLRWTPDGKSVVFTAALGPSKAEKARRTKFSEYQVLDEDFAQDQLWKVDVGAAAQQGGPLEASLLTTDPKLTILSFALSPDGARIAFSASPSPLLAVAAGGQDIYLMDTAAPGVAKKIVGLEGPDSAPMFSPDGARLAFVTALGDPHFFYANQHLAEVDIAEALKRPALQRKDVRDLTPSFDEDPRSEVWTKDGIYFRASVKLEEHLFKLDPQTLAVRRISSGDGLVMETASLTPDGGAAFLASDATHLSEIYVTPLPGYAPRRLTDSTAQVKDWAIGTVEPFSWRSKDGAMIDGVLHKPAGYDPTRKYPLLVIIHGGPTGQSTPVLMAPDYAYPEQSFLAKGALILEPNYRGSAGYGAAFRALNVRNLGVGDMWDVMSGIDALIAKGIVDPHRLGSMGWSQGGYISAFLTTHTDRFKAISVGAGISNWRTYYVATDITPFTPQYLKATPWADPDIYAKTSPMTTITSAKTPTLIQSGSEDRRVPVSNSLELYRGLKDMNVDTRLILYKGFGHGINKPKSVLALQQANLDWFDKYIWNEPIPVDSALYGTSELLGDTDDAKPEK
jgi:dipeptidyl aminopeptidase/acylaminoacyl peptidase